MKILDALDRLGVRASGRDAALGTILAATAVTGKDLNAIQGGHDLTLHPAGLEGLIALQLAIGSHQHLCERLEVETRQAVAQRVVAKGPWGVDALLELGLGQVGLQFFKAAQAEDEAIEQRPEHGGGISGSWRAS